MALLRRLRVSRGEYDWPMNVQDVDDFFGTMPLEFQDWFLIGVCVVSVILWCLPCWCGGIRAGIARSFMSWVYTRMHVFFFLITSFNIALICLTVYMLPGWSINQFAVSVVLVAIWVLDHMQKVLISVFVFFAVYLLWSFKERLALAAGLDHVTVVRLSFRDLLFPWAARSRYKPVEVFLWRAEDIPSGKIAKMNDLFAEFHLGHNEVAKTRVHNNAGSSCIFKESRQLNWDPTDETTNLVILIQDQGLLSSSEVARLELQPGDVADLLDLTKGSNPEADIPWEADLFEEFPLQPRGRLWVRLQFAKTDEENLADQRPSLPSLLRDPRSLVC